MKKKLKISILVILSPFFLFSQNIELSENSEISISGTSTLHDWTMTVDEYSGTGDFITEGTRIIAINNLKVIVKAESLKSGKTGMDKNAYKALKTGKYKDIVFILDDYEMISIIGNINKIRAKGTLTVAGKSRKVSFPVSIEVNRNGIISCSGSEEMKMTDFGVEPPTAMFGTIKTGDEITVNFNAQFSNINSTTLKNSNK